MAPRPKTYGARRSHAKPAGELVIGTAADVSERKMGNIDVMSTGIGDGKEKGLGIAPKEEKQNILSQGPRKEDGLALAKTVEECAAPERAPNVEDNSTSVSPKPWSLRNRRIPAQDMLPPDVPVKEHDSRRKSIRRSVDGSATPQNQNLITNKEFQPMLTDRGSPSYAKATFDPNGFTEHHQHSHVGQDIDLKDKPSDLHDLGSWVAQLVRRCHQDENPSSIISEPRQKEFRPQPGQDIEMSDALENVEDVRMTRGKEKKRLQLLKGKEPANGNDLRGKVVTGAGTSLKLRDAAPVERMLKDQLNDELKQSLFGSRSTTDMSANVIERNACGILLFNTIIDTGDSADGNPAAVLNSALEERQDDAPFLSALKILALSSEIMAFINFRFSQDDASRREVSNADESRPSTGAETSGATTITESSGPTSQGTSISNAAGVKKTVSCKNAMDKKNIEKQKRSRGVIQALEAATTILVQIQQGEAGADYITPYASGSMFLHPIGQRHLTSYGTPYGLPYPSPPTHGVAYGPPMGANLNNYASPYVTPLAPHPNHYASPYSSTVNQPTANYASPYANPMVPNQASGIGLGGSSNNQTNSHDGHETHHDNKEAHTSDPDVNITEAKKGNGKVASESVSNEEKDVSMSSKATDHLGIGNEMEEKGEAYDEADGQGLSNEKEVGGSPFDLDGTDVNDLKNPASGDKNPETSSDNNLTDDNLPVAKPDDGNVTPPAEDHKLFTGERLGDFTSLENIDWLLTMGNGGKMPKPSKKRRTPSPFTRPPSQADEKVQMEVNKIIDEIVLYQDWRGHPSATAKQLFYASGEGQRLAAELRRLMAIAKPVVNTTVPLAEGEARSKFYQQLESRAVKEKRDREAQQGINRFYGAPVQIQHWVPPTVGPPAVQFQMPPPLPSNGPMKVPFVRRGNVIAAPPGGRNIEEEKKAETYGYPPMPGSRPGVSQPGQKRKRAARH